MHLKKRGTVLISSMVILALMCILGGFIFNMMRNNIEMGSLYNFDKDRYDLDTKEEAILNKFMREINIKIKKDKSDSLDEKGIFSEDFSKVIGDSALEYHKEEDKLILKTQKDNETIRNRKITYSYKKDKIILIPTYMFEDTND